MSDGSSPSQSHKHLILQFTEEVPALGMASARRT